MRVNLNDNIAKLKWILDTGADCEFLDTLGNNGDNILKIWSGDSDKLVIYVSFNKLMSLLNSYGINGVLLNDEESD